MVCKVGSTALLNQNKTDVDEEVFKNICSNLTTNDILVSSGAVELGKIDFAKHKDVTAETLKSLKKSKLAARGQPILMDMYRKHFGGRIGVEQLLVEHGHFNDQKKREKIREDLMLGHQYNSITVVNYNDAVDYSELRKMEIGELIIKNGSAFDGTDNDETAVSIAKLVGGEKLLILSQLDGIYKDINNKDSLIREICGKTTEETIDKIMECQNYCNGASREGANGAGAKLKYVIDAVRSGMEVFIASSRSDIKEVLSGKAKSTRILTK